ncbi:hypothetical protein [Microcoleus sp. herbarium12]|uniref:hypothetical protein n=1 Tax=Microcoleus sp. herbarium12 TaxID=3055437 RepID=UPI002FD0A6AC
MNRKQRQRLGGAIASTMLSLAAVSLVGVDQAQAAVLTYNFKVQNNNAGSGFFKLSNSSLTGIGLEQVAVSEGIFNTILSLRSQGLQGKEYYNLAGVTALFYQGDFRGLRAKGSDTATTEFIVPPDAPGGPYSMKTNGSASWSMDTNGLESPTRWVSLFWGYKEVRITPINRPQYLAERIIINDTGVSYTLVDTAAEPVPEPIAAAGTALALAGLSWLKYQKKMAA